MQLTPLVWIYQGPIALGWVSFSALIFPILRKLGLWKPNGIDYTSVDMRGKVVIVTGCNTGIGRRTAVNICKMGAEVIMACRCLKRAEVAKKEMEAELKELITSSSSRSCYPFASEGKFLCMQCDLTSFESIKSFNKEFRKRYKKLNALVCNAGLANAPGTTTEGFEIMMGTNYVGHFLLVKLLLDVMIATKEGARIVNVSSLMHELGCLDFAGSFKGRYRSIKDRLFAGHYNDSKLAMVLHTIALRQQLKDKHPHVQAMVVSPGAVYSDIWRGFGKLYRRFFLDPVMTLLFLDNDQGSQTSVYAATQPLSTTGYYYFHPYWGCFDWLLPFEVMGPFNGWTAAIPRLPRHANQVAQDLWDLTEREIASHEKKD